MTRPEILQAAVDLWGVEAQVMMAIEEMAELTQALSKVYRKGWYDKEAVDHAREELADVRIMADQLTLILGLVASPEDRSVEEWESVKLARLEARLKPSLEVKNWLIFDGAGFLDESGPTWTSSARQADRYSWFRAQERMEGMKGCRAVHWSNADEALG